MTARTNDSKWIQTYTGIAFWPLDPRAEEVSIYDIAHALALTCRWTGHVSRHYSVGQHSVRVSYLVSKEWALHALLHDATEAYIFDVARPTKAGFTNYKKVEARLHKEIFRAFGLDPKLPDCVKEADNIMLYTEARDLMGPPPMPWMYGKVPELLSKKIRPWPMWLTELRFLWRFGGLTGTRIQTMLGWART